MRDGLVEQLHNAQQIIQEYKVRQKIAGDSWTVYRTTSNNAWDIQLTGLNTNSQYVKRWKVTYQIEGGAKIPNAFCMWMPKVNTGIPVTTDYMGNPLGYISGYTTSGFNYSFEYDGENPLVMYYMITAAYNWDATATNSFISVQFRALSPYKGSIKYEVINE